MVDVGQGTANGLYQAAQAGTFVMDQDAAEKCAAHYKTFADSLDQPLLDAYALVAISGFGPLTSARQLQAGFSTKASTLADTLKQMQSAAYKMAAAYLVAANQTGEADDMNKLALDKIGQEIAQ